MRPLTIKHLLLLLLFACLSAPLLAEDRLELDGISIIGNKELPKMLYIVPWKSSELPDLDAPPLGSLIDEALAPIDRDRFKRKIRYYQIYSKQNKAQGEKQ